MAWIESHQELLNHPKTLKLASLMSWDIYNTIGRLHAFWWWCLDYAPDGDLRKFNNAVLAQSVGLNASEGKAFVGAMVEAGWLDRKPDFRVHDWWDYVGSFLQVKYKAHPEKWKRVRAMYKQDWAESRLKDVPVKGCVEPFVESCVELSIDTSTIPNNPPNNGCNNGCNNSIPNLTLPNLTNPPYNPPLEGEIILPKFLKKETWEAYLEMRKKIRKPATVPAIKLILKKLEAFQKQGQDSNAILEQSILNSWQGIFPLQDKKSADPYPGGADKVYVPTSEVLECRTILAREIEEKKEKRLKEIKAKLNGQP